MKTPRELLLEHHQSAAPRLDAIRAEVLADLPSSAHRKAERQITSSFLREFLLPLRWHLAGMSALWVLAALLNIDPTTSVSQTAGNRSSSPQVLVALFENRRQVAEMIDPPDESAITPPLQQPMVPRRRSALQPLSVVV